MDSHRLYEDVCHYKNSNTAAVYLIVFYGHAKIMKSDPWYNDIDVSSISILVS